MVDSRLVDYILRLKSMGVADALIYEQASIGGFAPIEIEEAFRIATDASQLKVPVVQATAQLQQPAYAGTHAPADMNAILVKAGALGKFRASRIIFAQSWKILSHDKELLLFPVVSAFVMIATMALLGWVYFVEIFDSNINALLNFSSTVDPVVQYGVIFFYYLISILVTNYFLAGMMIIIDGRFKGYDYSFGDGMRGAGRNIGAIFVWSLISATIGLLLKIIEDRGKIFGKIIALILGATWAIFTYFSLPSLVLDGVGVKESFKQSVALIRKTWGETIIVSFGIGLVVMLLLLAGLCIVIGLSVLFPEQSVLLAVWITFAVFVLGLSILSATLSVIFKVALFRYAKDGVVPAGFSPEVIAGAIQKKKG